MNKRGQGLSTNAIILIILGVIVLVVLAIGFSVGWAKFAPWLSKDNVNDIVTACNTACATNSFYDFCTLQRDLTDSDKNNVKASCEEFSKSYPKYGVAECPNLCASASTTKTYSSLSAAKEACIKVDAVLTYIENNVKKTYSCTMDNLATSESSAKNRCTEAGQVVNWNNNQNVAEYTCGSTDVK